MAATCEWLPPFPVGVAAIDIGVGIGVGVTASEILSKLEEREGRAGVRSRPAETSVEN